MPESFLHDAHLPRSGRRIIPARSWPSICGSLRLSPRELEITKLIFDNQSKESMALQLNISPHTVQSYTTRLYRKLGVNSQVELVIHVLGEYLRLREEPAAYE